MSASRAASVSSRRPPPPDEQRRVGLLDGLRQAVVAGDRVVLARHAERSVAEAALEHRHGLGQPRHPDADRVERQPERVVLRPVPAGPDRHLDAPAAQHVERGQVLGEQRRVAQVVVGHERRHAQPVRDRGDRGEQRHEPERDHDVVRVDQHRDPDGLRPPRGGDERRAVRDVARIGQEAERPHRPALPADEAEELADDRDLLRRPVERVVEREPGEPGVEIRPECVRRLFRRAGEQVRAAIGRHVVPASRSRRPPWRPPSPASPSSLDRARVAADRLAVARQDLGLVAHHLEAEREPVGHVRVLRRDLQRALLAAPADEDPGPARLDRPRHAERRRRSGRSGRGTSAGPA